MDISTDIIGWKFTHTQNPSAEGGRRDARVVRVSHGRSHLRIRRIVLYQRIQSLVNHVVEQGYSPSTPTTVFSES
jgi:hypothetical protein